MSKLRANAPSFFPEKEQKNRDKLKKILTKRLINVFKNACKHRKKEIEILKKVKEKIKKDKRKDKNIVEQEAFKELRNHKNDENILNDKIELLEELDNIEGVLRESYIERLELYQSEEFKKFLKNNPSCKKIMRWKGENFGRYEELEDYLQAGFDRKEAIERNKANKNNKAIRTKNGIGIIQLKPLKGGKSTKKTMKSSKKIKRKIHTGPKGGKYYINNGKKVYM